MFYLIEVTTYSDETPKAKGMYEYETELDAIANFHTKLGGAMKNEKYATELVMVSTEDGVVIAKEYFVRPSEPEVEPEVEPTEEG